MASSKICRHLINNEMYVFRLIRRKPPTANSVFGHRPPRGGRHVNVRRFAVAPSPEKELHTPRFTSCLSTDGRFQSANQPSPRSTRHSGCDVSREMVETATNRQPMRRHLGCNERTAIVPSEESSIRCRCQVDFIDLRDTPAHGTVQTNSHS